MHLIQDILQHSVPLQTVCCLHWCYLLLEDKSSFDRARLAPETTRRKSGPRHFALAALPFVLRLFFKYTRNRQQCLRPPRLPTTTLSAMRSSKRCCFVSSCCGLVEALLLIAPLSSSGQFEQEAAQEDEEVPVSAAAAAAAAAAMGRLRPVRRTAVQEVDVVFTKQTDTRLDAVFLDTVKVLAARTSVSVASQCTVLRLHRDAAR